MQDEASRNSCHDAHGIAPNPCRNALTETLRSQLKALHCPQYCKTPVCLDFRTAKTSFTSAMVETSTLCVRFVKYFCANNVRQTTTHIFIRHAGRTSACSVHAHRLPSRLENCSGTLDILTEHLGKLLPHVVSVS